MIKYFLIRNFRGTWSPVETLKGYMFRERLGTPAVTAHVHVQRLVAFVWCTRRGREKLSHAYSCL